MIGGKDSSRKEEKMRILAGAVREPPLHHFRHRNRDIWYEKENPVENRAENSC